MVSAGSQSIGRLERSNMQFYICLTFVARIQAGAGRICPRSYRMVVHWLLWQSAVHRSDWRKARYPRLAWWRMQGSVNIVTSCWISWNFCGFCLDFTDGWISAVVIHKKICGQTMCFMLDRIMFVRRSVAVVFWACNFDLAKIWFFLCRTCGRKLLHFLCSVYSFSCPALIAWQYLVITGRATVSIAITQQVILRFLARRGDATHGLAWNWDLRRAKFHANPWIFGGFRPKNAKNCQNF